ncbi:MAG: hypothetical protein RLZZ398_353 [Verrucomicrobiota bacterium]
MTLPDFNLLIPPFHEAPAAECLGDRPLRVVELKQRVLYACLFLPPGLWKSARKIMWPGPLRHMRYVLPSVALHPLRNGCWRLRSRSGPTVEWVSRPISDIKGFTRRPSIIIATGPSASNFDWSTLMDGDRLIWAVNGAPTMLANHGLKADFLVITDHRFARDGADHIALAVDQGATLLFAPEAVAGFAATQPEVLARARFHVFEKVNRWYGLPILDPAELVAANEESGRPFLLPDSPVPGVGWSRDPMLGVFAGKTVPFAALQLVVWAGSQTVEIVGMDLGGSGHAYVEDQPVVSHLEKDYRQFILPSFECMAAALTGSPLRIHNLSPTCPLPEELFDWKRPIS